MKKRQKIYGVFKRCLDIICSFLAIVILSPLLLLLSLLVKCTSKGPILFKQTRVGKKHKNFKIWKFRSMRIEAPKNAATRDLEDPDMYITRFGHFIRKTSLDELPQLFNILSGKMSFIGPRPTIPEEIELMEEREKYNVYAIRPGMTGLAQVHGRDVLTDSTKGRLDGMYVQKFSFILDVKIFFKTILYVLKRDGVVEGKHDATEQEIKVNIEAGELIEEKEKVHNP